MSNNNGTQTIKDDKTPLAASKKSAKSSNEKIKNNDVPKAAKADNSYNWLWILVVIAACGVVTGVVLYKKKKNKDAE